MRKGASLTLLLSVASKAVITLAPFDFLKSINGRKSEELMFARYMSSLIVGGLIYGLTNHSEPGLRLIPVMLLGSKVILIRSSKFGLVLQCESQ
jgi:hypothetical protein